MCFYNEYIFACGDYKWGHFRQHCSKESRIGETCGTKLVMNTVNSPEKCNLCQKIETKYRQLRKREERIQRWTRERGPNRAPAPEYAWREVEQLQEQIVSLQQARLNRRQTFDGRTAMEDIEDSKPEIEAQ